MKPQPQLAEKQVQNPPVSAGKKVQHAAPASSQLQLQKQQAELTPQGLKTQRVQAAQSAHADLNKQLAASQSRDIASASANLVPMRTLSGKSLGSLGEYSMDWNNADMCDESSMPQIPEYPPPALPAGVELDPASPITIGQRLYELKAATLRLDRSIEVILLPQAELSILVYYSQSPRFGLVNLLSGVNLFSCFII